MKFGDLGPYAARVQDAVRQGGPLVVQGGGSKAALSRGATLELGDVSGVLEYAPQEYTLTALAGTPLAEVAALLAAEGQYLPFDPPFAEIGATLGGTVAAGLSGPGRMRYGGVRDFLLGVRFVDGTGALLSGGGKVVKNAAGFDLPKLLVGSLGQFGVMLELTFKVFPLPESYATLELGAANFAEAEALLRGLARSRFEPHALELLPPTRVLVRFGGLHKALPERLERVQATLGQAGEVLVGDAEAEVWRGARAFRWLPPDHALVKVVHSPGRLLEIETALGPLALPRRYSVGGNVLYLGLPPEISASTLDALLQRLELSGLALTGELPTPQLGRPTGNVFLERVRRVFDPHGIFSPTEVTGAA